MLIGKYMNGNYKVSIFSDGTKIRENDLDFFAPAFPENIDIKITNFCNMACPFCFVAGTKILMSDFTYKNIEEIEVGEEIIGFEEYPASSGAKRAMVKTRVKKKFAHVEDEIIECTTADGGYVLATPNHPFLTASGTSSNHALKFNRLDRIKAGDKLMRYGFPNDKIDYDGIDYKAGYVVGAWLGDGSMHHYVDKNGYDAFNCRFVTKDEEINQRVFDLTKQFVPDVYQLDFKMKEEATTKKSVRSNKSDAYNSLKVIIENNLGHTQSKEYAAGYLAGFIDSEGHVDNERSVLRMCNTERSYIDECIRCLDMLGIEYAEEYRAEDATKKTHNKALHIVRIKGQYAMTRCLWYTRPACIRKSLDNFLNFNTQYYAHTVVSKKTLQEKQYVYNLETDSHTYVANNFLVHNCHEGSSLDGEHAELDEAFIDTLHPYTELAIGGGNPLSHPRILHFLEKLQQKKIIANMTVHQVHFMEYAGLIKSMVAHKLVYGVGISMIDPSDEFIAMVKTIPNAVIHVINGIVTMEQLERLYDNGLKVLVLGCKDLRRGARYHDAEVDRRKADLYDALPEVRKHFKVLSFDNLAIEQLDVRRIVPADEWDQFYMGDDGNYTMYIDMVNREFAKSSTSLKRYPMMDSIDDMFSVVRSEANGSGVD